MKKLCLFILIVLLLPVTSSFAATGQRIIIPYAQVGGGYWSGVAILNPSGEGSMTFSIGVYNSNAVWHSGIGPFTVEGHAMKVDLLNNFFGGDVSGDITGRVSVQIQTNTDAPFQATLFIGNDGGGFGFQNYESKGYTY